MELFEILFIALFILFPIMEQLLRRRKGDGPEVPDTDDLDRPMDEERDEASPWETEPESVGAAEMVPDDLWAILTGEERRSERVDVDEERAARPEPASDPVPERWDDAWTPEFEPAEVVEVPAPEPTLPTAAPLGRAALSPEARHRRFHDIIDRRDPRPRRRRSRVGRAVASPGSLRQAFVLTEVLGPPKGLD